MPRRTQTHCKRGHELAGNHWTQLQGQYVNRVCKTCKREHGRRETERKQQMRRYGEAS